LNTLHLGTGESPAAGGSAHSNETGAIWLENSALREAAFANLAAAKQAEATGDAVGFASGAVFLVDLRLQEGTVPLRLTAARFALFILILLDLPACKRKQSSDNQEKCRSPKALRRHGSCWCFCRYCGYSCSGAAAAAFYRIFGEFAEIPYQCDNV
jgi:hypothetical protein